MAELVNRGIADFVELNEIVQVSPIVQNNQPAPPPIDYEVNDPALNQLWSFKAMQMQTFYQVLAKAQIKPKKVAKIAILDTGVDGSHEDLNANFISTNPDYDRDAVGHGTHCAGIAGAVSNNAKGIASFSLNNEFVKITSIKVLNDFGGGTQESVIGGIIEAADGGADVISMSLGGPSTDSHQKAYEEAIKYAQKSGAIVIVAAGNSDENAQDFTPANVEGVITVTAVDENLQKAEFSNYITDLKRGIAAPGVGIYATFPNNEYKVLSGTSMATPYVAGLVAVMKALKPELSTDQVYEILRQTGIATKDAAQTGSFIQPAKAVMGVLTVKP